jgi:hypothetical protein
VKMTGRWESTEVIMLALKQTQILSFAVIFHNSFQGVSDSKLHPLFKISAILCDFCKHLCMRKQFPPFFAFNNPSPFSLESMQSLECRLHYIH